jgi:hypothetical protein
MDGRWRSGMYLHRNYHQRARVISLVYTHTYIVYVLTLSMYGHVPASRPFSIHPVRIRVSCHFEGCAFAPHDIGRSAGHYDQRTAGRAS